jgi:hypothetical protein
MGHGSPRCPVGASANDLGLDVVIVGFHVAVQRPQIQQRAFTVTRAVDDGLWIAASWLAVRARSVRVCRSLRVTVAGEFVGRRVGGEESGDAARFEDVADRGGA